MKYVVNVREVWIQPVEIEADSIEEAISKVEEGEGIYNESGILYSHTLETEYWDIKCKE